jgi:hypothetical protein
MQAQIRAFEQQVASATIWRLFFPEDSITVHLNMSARGKIRLNDLSRKLPSRNRPHQFFPSI